jgi:nicotinate-nucleotide pyrophosphorylase (carboxylating)
MTLNSIYVDNLIKTALLEDINYLDTTTDYLIDENQENTAIFLAKSSGVLCGIEVALRVFEILQPNGFEAKVYKHDGDKLVKGEIIAEIHGKTRTILKGERTALNLIQHMSGIATATNKAVEIVSGTKASIADTRKTLPGMRLRSEAEEITVTIFPMPQCSRITTLTQAAELPTLFQSLNQNSVI